MGVNGLGTEPPLTSELSFERRWSIGLRAGARVSVALGLLALVVTVVAAAALVIAFATNATSPADTATPKTIDGTRVMLLLVVALGSVVVAATWRLWRVVTRDGQWVTASPTLPAVVERDGRLVIEKYAGQCPECGSRLRFYNRPVRWHDEPDEAGRRPVVDERSPAAECRSDLRHWWIIDRRSPGAATAPERPASSDR